MRAWEELVGRPRMRVMVFQEMAPKSPASNTCWFTSSMCTMPLPMVLATAVPKTNAATKLKKAAQTTARKGVRTRVETTVAMELAASCQPFENSNARVTKTTMNRRVKLVIGRSGAFEDDAFDDVGDVFALVDGGFDDFENLFPFDDLDGILLFVEELGNEGTAEAVTVVLVAVDFDAVLKGFLRCFQGADSNLNLSGRRNQDLDEIDGSVTDAVDAIEHKSAGSRVDQINHVVQAAAELVNVLTVKRRDESLIQLREEGVGNLVALVLDGFDDLHLLRHTGVVRQHFMQGVGPDMDIPCLFGEKVEETNFARQKPLQNSWHGI